MKNRLKACIFPLAAALAGPSFALAGGLCSHPECGPECRDTVVVTTHRHVPEVGFREIRYKVRKPRSKTELVLDKMKLVRPVYEPAVETGHATVSLPFCEEKTCLEPCEECRPETVMRPTTVDAGHWATVRVGCGHLCKKHHHQRQVWVPKIVETCVPTTEIVCREVMVPRTHAECHDVPTPITFPIRTSTRRYESEEVDRHVEVTTQEWVEEEVVIQVPFVGSRCVTCRREIEPEVCPPKCASTHGHARPGELDFGAIPTLASFEGPPIRVAPKPSSPITTLQPLPGPVH